MIPPPSRWLNPAATSRPTSIQLPHGIQRIRNVLVNSLRRTTPTVLTNPPSSGGYSFFSKLRLTALGRPCPRPAFSSLPPSPNPSAMDCGRDLLSEVIACFVSWLTSYYQNQRLPRGPCFFSLLQAPHFSIPSRTCPRGAA